MLQSVMRGNGVPTKLLLPDSSSRKFLFNPASPPRIHLVPVEKISKNNYVRLSIHFASLNLFDLEKVIGYNNNFMA